MPGPVPGIHDFGSRDKDVDGRDEPGHDAGSGYAPSFGTLWLSKATATFFVSM